MSMMRTWRRSIRPARWDGSFTKSGVRAMSPTVLAVDLAAIARAAEALAVVGGHDDQRAVIEPGGPQPFKRAPEQAIGELDL